MLSVPRLFWPSKSQGTGRGTQVKLGRAWLPYFYKGDKPGIPDVVLVQQVGQQKDAYIVGHILPDCPDLSRVRLQTAGP